MRRPARQQGLNIRYGLPEPSKTMASVVEMFLTTKGEKKKTRPRSVAFVCVFCVCKKTHYHRKHRPKPHRKTSGGTAWGALVVTVKQSFTANRAAEPRGPIAAVLSNPFGVFAFEPVLPCSAYTVTARHRFFSFGAPAQIEPKDFPPDGSGVTVTIVYRSQTTCRNAIEMVR